MNPSDDPFAPPGSPRQEEDRQRASRRAAILGGLGKGSVVLGALASKPVLGAVPYHCTVSGQVSGNLSRPGLAAACVLGQPTSTWIATETWPGLTKGTAPSRNCGFGGEVSPGIPRDRGTAFNRYRPNSGVPRLIDAFFNESLGSGQSAVCTVQTGATNNRATMLQVLMTTSTDDQFVLGRTVVTSLLNAAALTTTYPVTAHTIIAMFNATFDGVGTYPVTTTNSWSRARVIEYLQSLYSPD